MKKHMKFLLCGAIISAGAVSANAATKHLGVLIPPQYDEWLSDIPMLSMDGGKTGTAMPLDPDHCGWAYADIDTDKLTDNVVMFRKRDTAREDMIGVSGNWEKNAVATPIPLATFFKDYDVDSLYFVPDEGQFLTEGDDGWYPQFPEGAEGVCKYDIPMVVYDTDAKLHPAFSCYGMTGEGCQKGVQGISESEALKATNACIGVTTGLVENTLDETVNQFKRKPKLTKKGTACFFSEELFSQLFNATQDVNEASCTTLPLMRSSNYGWGFESDFFQSPGAKAPGGFFPVEQSTDESIKAMGSTPLADARVKRAAEGPIFYGPELRKINEATGYANIKTVCNGPGWDGGKDCEGIFGDGDMTEALIQSIYRDAKCVIGWSCPDQAPEGWSFFKIGTETVLSSSENKFSGSPRWTGERNQHFCTESHLTFTYNEGQTFSVLGDDDIWVYIDNKLAIDLGGTHLAAPGFVDLNKFVGKSGKLVVGESYNLDMFTCDRRTTMSNLTIETNIFMRAKQSSIQVQASKDQNSSTTTNYQICYKKSQSDCQSMINGTIEDPETCTSTPSIKFILSKGENYNSDESEVLEIGKVHHGGIDLTNINKPLIDRSKINDLSDGEYTLFAEIEGKYKKITSFRIGGEDAITTKPVAASNLKVHSNGASIAITAQGAKTYAVMDMMGRVLKSGNLMNGQANIPMNRTGSFMVRVGNQTQRVNLK